MHNTSSVGLVAEQYQNTNKSNQNRTQAKKKSQSQQCLFFRLPCTTKSNQNRETLINQKALINEKHIQLFQKKHLKLQTIQRKIPQNTHTSMDKTSQKGISISMNSNKNDLKQKSRKSIEQQAIMQVDFPKKFQGNTQNKIDPQNILTQKKHYHQLNPLSIDRAKYHIKQVKIGGDKHNNSVSFVIPGQRINCTSASIFVQNASFPKKRHIIFRPSFRDHQRVSSIAPYNYNYEKDCLRMDQSLYQTVRPQRNFSKLLRAENSLISSRLNCQNQLRYGYQLRSEPIYHIKTQHQNLQSALTKHNESTAYHIHNSSVNQHSLCQKTQEIFDKINIENSHQNHLQTSTYSAYSQKYRQYMSKQLVSPSNHHNPFQLLHHEMPELMENVRVQVDSINSEQNQKNQTYFIPSLPKPNYQDHKRNQIDGSYSSSFVVIEGRQKPIQSTRRIYQPSNIDSYSIPESGLINQLDQLMIQDLQSNKKIHTQTSIIHNLDHFPLPQLQIQILSLSETLNQLQAEEHILNEQNQKYCAAKLQQLGKDIQMLETLKLVSEQRAHQIAHLKELLKIKVIQPRLSLSPELKDKYLNNQRNWELQLGSEMDFQKTRPSFDTNQTLNNNKAEPKTQSPSVSQSFS